MAYLGENTPKLGFGLMRLPTLEDKTIDIEQTKQMVDLFMQAGFTYFDTAWSYEGSEAAAKQALVDRYPRDSYTLATKLAAWVGCETREQAIAQFETSLERTGAGYFDYYLLHNLGGPRTEFFDRFDLWNWAMEQKEKGLIRHFGFSFHASAEQLDAILTAHPEAEFVQLQINYADWEDSYAQSRKLYETARKHNKPVVIMEPVKGGLLANPPEAVAKLLKEANPDASCASWAVKYAASLPGVIAVLSGMSNIEQVADNTSYMKDFKGMSEEERKVIQAAQEILAAIPLIPCTSCNYCAKVCPQGIGISGTFGAMNHYRVYQNVQAAKFRHHWNVEVPGKAFADTCLECGQCEDVCPQHIAIREQLKEAAALLLK